MSEVKKEVNNEDSMLGYCKEWPNELNRSAPANFLHYSTYEERLSSFDSWSNCKPKPELLSEAGFFYLGHDDRTVCFHCGGGLNEWKELDNPWVEHAYWFPRCLYILQIKGQTFVNDAVYRKRELDLIQEKKKTDFNTDTNKHSYMHSKKESTLSNPVNEDTSHLNTKVEESVSPIICKICFLHEKNILYIPCRHIVACLNCSSDLSICPICREPIVDKIKVFHS